MMPSNSSLLINYYISPTIFKVQSSVYHIITKSLIEVMMKLILNSYQTSGDCFTLKLHKGIIITFVSHRKFRISVPYSKP